MRCNGGIVHEVGGKWTVEEIEVDPPKAGELIVQWKVAGMCHSDEHVVTGDMIPTPEAQAAAGITKTFPLLGGHEGAGVVVEVGPEVTSVRPGDHVSSSFMPSCGRCRMCSTGRQALCDNGRATFQLGMITDGTSRHRIGDEELLLFAKLGTFAQYSCVAESQVIKVDSDFPLEAECNASVTSGLPRVKVPVLSRRTVLNLWARSSASPERMRMPFSAPLPVPTTMAVGVAKPMAHGQAITNTATVLMMAFASGVIVPCMA